MEDDPYGFCHNLDRQIVKVLDKKGLDALVGPIRAKFESVPSRDEQRFPKYARRKWGGALKALLAGQRDVEGYIALCEQIRNSPALRKMRENGTKEQNSSMVNHTGTKTVP